MAEVVEDFISCDSCNYVFQTEDLEYKGDTKKPCPKCGSLIRCIHATIKEIHGHVGYFKAKAKSINSRHKSKRADHETEKGVKRGRDNTLVYKERVIDRNNPSIVGSYRELVKDLDGNIIVDKTEKLSEHYKNKKNDMWAL